MWKPSHLVAWKVSQKDSVDVRHCPEGWAYAAVHADVALQLLDGVVHPPAQGLPVLQQVVHLLHFRLGGRPRFGAEGGLTTLLLTNHFRLSKNSLFENLPPGRGRSPWPLQPRWPESMGSGYFSQK